MPPYPGGLVKTLSTHIYSLLGTHKFSYFLPGYVFFIGLCGCRGCRPAKIKVGSATMPKGENISEKICVTGCEELGSLIDIQIHHMV
jgi:hypothetical protein